MSWFKKKKPGVEITRSEDHENRVEVVVHKNATHDAVVKAEEANETLNQLLIENGFTLKIYLAAGGHLPPKKNGKNK